MANKPLAAFCSATAKNTPPNTTTFTQNDLAVGFFKKNITVY
jgi:hypothetical protein